MARSKKQEKLLASLYSDNGLKKSKNIIFRLPLRCRSTMKELLTKYNIENFQTLFDILIVGGVLYKKTEILDFIRKHLPDYRDKGRRRVLTNLKKMDRAEAPVNPKMYTTNVRVYPQDYVTLQQFTIEENIKQQWIWNIIFEEGFCNEEPMIIDLIQRYQKLEITARKAAAARLLDEKYVDAIPENDAKKILEIVTREYDERSFDYDIASYIEGKIKMDNMTQEEREEAELELEFNNKINKLRATREKDLEKIMKLRKE